MGIEIEAQVPEANHAITFVSYEGGANKEYLNNVAWTINIEKVQFKITDNTATALVLDDLVLTGLIRGQGYYITKQTSDLVSMKALDYDLDEALAGVVTTSSLKGIVKDYPYGGNAFDIFQACRSIDKQILRLMHSAGTLTLYYKTYATIADAGDISEDIINYTSASVAGSMYNVVKIKDMYGTEIVRAWDYTHGYPVNDTIVGLPAGMIQREIVLTAPMLADATVCKEIADAYLYDHAPLKINEDDTLELAVDPDYQPGERVSFTYEGVTYTNYLITRKKFDTKSGKCTLKLVKYV